MKCVKARHSPKREVNPSVHGNPNTGISKGDNNFQGSEHFPRERTLRPCPFLAHRAADDTIGEREEVTPILMACPPGLTTLEPVPTEPADRDARPFVADAQLRWNPVKDGLKP